ncbi:aldehyde dehydrogenase [Diaminobutyricibacter sp. McL0618]|uniref:aldehyde dehydrogenase n=1 Tax=Leifsonia sp. McL0618 TaxID=3415677 RepID=UPI003CE820C4
MDMSMMMGTTMMQGTDMTAMQNLLEASSACEQACTMCAGSSLGMAGMEKCAAMCLNCADMSNTMMRMVLRPAAMDLESGMAMMQACMVMATACAAECSMHVDMNEQCRMCAKACQEMAAACEAMMASVKAMM